MPSSNPANRGKQRFNRYWRKRGAESPREYVYEPGRIGAPIQNLSEEAERKRNRAKELRNGAPKQRDGFAREKVHRLIAGYKLAHPCVDCGEADPRCLDFDHRDRAAKSFNISQARGNRSLKSVEAEIAKCDVRCANCHRKKTMENQDFIALEDWERSDWEDQI